MSAGSGSSELVKTLASYLPNVVLNHLQDQQEASEMPVGESLHGAVLIADLSGFTTLTEQLSRRGVEGAEELTRVLNDYFGRVVDCIGAAGGDVVRFAGDAILAIWSSAPGAFQADAIRSAARCALDLQGDLQGYTTDAGTPLAIKIGIGGGDFTVMHLGGEFDRCEFLVTGLAFVQSFAALDQADAGQVVVSLQAWSELSEHYQGEPLQMGSVRLIHRTDAADKDVSNTASDQGPAAELDVRQLSESSVRSYVPATVCARLAAGQENWLGELRMVSVLFVNLPEVNYAMPLDRAQLVMQYLQQELYRFEGSINKLNVDDKGTSLVAAMGLPPMSHEDDAKRAVYAAMSMQRRLLELGLRSSVGIASGRVFCGSIGNARRREYTIMGDTVNLAARLMQTALGDIHCDEVTAELAGDSAEFQRLADINIKGKTKPVAVYRPVQATGPTRAPKTALIGRDTERRSLDEAIQAFVGAWNHRSAIQDPPANAVVVIEGPPGMGKSRLVDELLARAAEHDVTCFTGAGDSIETATLYWAWRPIIHQLLGLDAARDGADVIEQQVSVFLDQDPSLPRERAPLLNPVLGTEFPDNEHTRYMTGSIRGDNTRELLHQLLRTAALQQPAVVVLDDAHWMDSASWALVAEVVRDRVPMMLVQVSRPTDEGSDVYDQLRQDPRTRRIQLDRLTRHETGALLASRLEVADVPAELVDAVYGKAEGNPLFTQQLANVVCDALVSDTQELPPTDLHRDFEWQGIELPGTVHGAITSQIDHLPPASQLALKVASVIGRHFSFQLLQASFPIPKDRVHVREYLSDSLRANLIEVETTQPSVTYRFQHVITRDVAYELLLFDQRRQLHRAIAEWLEQSDAQHRASHAAVLAHHWLEANETRKAVEYFELAGETSLRNGAYTEAIDLLQNALRHTPESAAEDEWHRLARWHRQLGEAYLGVGKLTQSVQSFESALDVLECPVPASRAGLLMNLASEMATQFGRRLQRVMRRGPMESRSKRLTTAMHNRWIEATRTYERLAETYYLANNRARLLQALLATLNRAESVGPSPELARAYANACFAAGLAGAHRLARGYAEDARRIADVVDDPSALGWVHQATGIYQLGHGEFANAQQNFAAAMPIFRRLGDWTHWGETIAAAAQGHYYVGEVEKGRAAWNELEEVARHRGDPLQLAWALNGLAEYELHATVDDDSGDKMSIATAIARLEQAIELYRNNVDRISLLGSYGLLARAHRLGGARQAAERSADLGLQLARELGAPTGYYSLNGYALIAETYLALQASTSDIRARDAAKSRQACRLLNRYAATFRIGRPAALRNRGTLLSLLGHEAAARRNWSRAQRMAEQLGMADAIR